MLTLSTSRLQDPAKMKKNKFQLGDGVYIVDRKEEEYFSECGFCGGNGAFTGLNGETDACRRCRNGKLKTGYKIIHTAVPYPYMIYRIWYDETMDSDYKKRKPITNKIRYNLHPTDDHMWGGAFTEDMMFKTFQDAEKEAKKLNSEETIQEYIRV
jgi:hypothetical protein